MPETTELIEPQEISVMSFEGEGTQENPYQITTVAEFRSMNDSTAYFKLMNDLDVNDSEWASNWTTATLSFKHLDGGGFTISNINYIGSNYAISLLGDDTVYNINFANLIAIGSLGVFFTRTSTKSTTYDHCNFSLVVDVQSIFYRVTVDRTNISNCVFSLSGKMSDTLTGYSLSPVTNTHIYLDDFEFATTSTSGIFNDATRVMVRGNAYTTYNSVNLFYSCTQCYIALDMTQSALKISEFSYHAPTSTCFYDKDLMGTEITTQTKLYALTTEQCKDKDYLNSIGFVVV